VQYLDELMYPMTNTVCTWWRDASTGFAAGDLQRHGRSAAPSPLNIKKNMVTDVNDVHTTTSRTRVIYSLKELAHF
jgi:hypothetical protein